MVANIPRLPGVYWETVFPETPPPFVTGVPAFLGVLPTTKAGRISLYQPQALSLWKQFEQFFGMAKPQNLFARTVQGFFENGGEHCQVIWLADLSAAALEQGLNALTLLPNVDLVCVPELAMLDDRLTVQQRQAQILRHCDEGGDCFALLDAWDARQGAIADIQAQVQFLTTVQGSQRGAIYGPWLKVAAEPTDEPPLDEPARGTTQSNLPLTTLPPCGHVAGVYARSDRTGGVYQAPANLPLEGVFDLQNGAGWEAITGLNPLRYMRGRGVRIWGGRTLNLDDPQWRYVNVSRLMITLQRWIETNLVDVNFEANDIRLWLRIERELNAYLLSLWQQGAFQGETPAAGFWVRCDAETNPPARRDRGEVVTEIGVAPTIPNEFIRVRLVQGETGVSLTPQAQTSQ